MGRFDDDLLPVFARQHWLATMADVTAAGGSPRHVDVRLARGTWERADLGVYRLAGAPRPWEARVLAPILSIGPDALASHLCAAALHGIPGFGRGTPELSVTRGLGARRPNMRLHTSTDLDRCRATEISAIPVTDINRTLLDIGRNVGQQRLLRSIEWARRTGATDWTGLITTLRVHARRGRPGVARLRQAITANAHREEVTDSNFELMFLALLAEHGIPEPVVHFKVLDDGRFVAEVDLAFPDLKIAIELDGPSHLDEEVREDDLPRQNDLVLTGWTVLRFTWRRFVERPASIIAEVRAALRHATS